MGLNLAVLWSPWIIFGITSIVVVTVIVVLTLVEKFLDRKIRRKTEEEQSFFREKIDYLKSEESKPEQFLVDLNQIVLEVFKEALELPNDTTYDEAIRLFRERGNIKAVRFANKIQTFLYSGEKIDNAKLDSLLRELTDLINDFMKIEQKKKAESNAEGFENRSEKFLDKTTSLKEEYNKIERVKDSPEEEINVLRRSVSGEEKEVSKRKSDESEANEEKSERIEKEVPLEVREKEFRVVPVQKEEVQHRKVMLSKKDSRKYLEVGSLDDLARIKEKIRIKKESLKF